MALSSIKWACRLAFPALLAFVTYTTIAPDPGDVVGVTIADWIARFVLGDEAHADKAGHFIAYASLSGAFTLAQYVDLRSSAFGIFVLAAYGAALEGVQRLSPERQTDLLDGVANLVGALAAYLIAAAVIILARRVFSGRRSLSEES